MNEQPTRTGAVLSALLAAGLLVYAFSNSYTLFDRLLLPKSAYIPGGIGIVLLLVAEWLWLRQP